MQQTYQQAATHLSSHDPYLAQVIAQHGLCTIAPHTNYYQDLVESIIGQQLSVKAAATIRKRFVALFETFPEPQDILDMPVETLRTAGLSYQKATYIQDLARHVLEGKIQFGHLDSLANDEVIRELTAVKGIGEWTVHMFLMFCMGRLDVVAHGDLGIRNGAQKIYGLDHVPAPQEIDTLAERYQWQPYASIACWYIWQALDNEPSTTS